MHINIIFKYILSALVLFYLVGQIGYLGSKQFIKDSGFRITSAVSGNEIFHQKDVVGFIGDSRFMDGFNANHGNKITNNVTTLIYNFAFNGLQIDDSVEIIKIFLLNCDCTLKRLIINVDSVINKDARISDVRLFSSGFNRESINTFEFDSVAMKNALKVFPLLHFNNEFFLRSIYYKFKNESDQSHSNSYKFRVSSDTKEKLRVSGSSTDIDYKKLKVFRDFLGDRGIELVTVMTPRHQVYTKNKKNFRAFIRSVESGMNTLSIKLLVHSELYINNSEYFSDLIHLNTLGQIKYTEYLKSIGLLSL